MNIVVDSLAKHYLVLIIYIKEPNYIPYLVILGV